MSYISFTTGTPIAIVQGGCISGQIIYLHNPDIHERPRRREEQLQEFRLPKDYPGKLFVYPSLDPEQCYISGPNKSGKTTWVGNWIRIIRSSGFSKRLARHNKELPEIPVPIYIFSDLESDAIIDNIDGYQPIRIELGEHMIEEPIDPKELYGSVVIFDDIDSIANPKIKKAVETLKDTLLKTSRHHNCWVICTSHLSTDYGRTRVVLNECRSITLFPKCGAWKQVERVLKDYSGMTARQIEIIRELPGRWVTLQKDYPLFITWERGIMLL